MSYSDQALDHYESPCNVGSFEKGDDMVSTGIVGAPAYGNMMKLQAKVSGQDVVEDAKFETYNCGLAIVSSLLVTEWVEGKTLDQALETRSTTIAEGLVLLPVKAHHSIPAEDAIKTAAADYKEKHDSVEQKAV